MTFDPSTMWIEESRELCLTCDADGVVRWADARALHRLGPIVGESLRSRAVDGVEDKIDRLLARAKRDAVKNSEIALQVDGAVLTLSVCAKPGPDGSVLLLGCTSAQEQHEALRQVQATIDETVDLNREIARQKRELERRNTELDESNQAIRTLHGEIAEKAESLKRAADVRGRVVANVSHEFRTPLHTILGLSRLLMDSPDAPLDADQLKQMQFIRTSAEELLELVNNLLDLSKVESGRVFLHSRRLPLADVFAALRGMLRPLVETPDAVELVFEDVDPTLMLETDDGKISQILRNLVSNALKFTDRGEVRVSARLQGELVVFEVRDTGIGIAPHHFDTIFEEFGQIEDVRSNRVKGTGLGLPLSRKLAELLGGSLTVRSEVGVGSTFTLTIPREHPEVHEMKEIEARPIDPEKTPILVVEDDRKTIFVYERYLAMAGFQAVPARSVEDARRILQEIRPAAVLLDIMLEGESSWGFLSELKRNPETADIPVLVVTVTTKERKARALGADEFWLKPIEPDRLIRKLHSLSRPSDPAQVLVIDDDPKARFILRKCLEGTPYRFLEADSGMAGVEIARGERPNIIFLDFLLHELTAFDVLDELKADPRTRSIPIIIVTSHQLDEEARSRLAEQTAAIVSKQHLSRELAINRIRDALSKAGVSHRIGKGA